MPQKILLDHTTREGDTAELARLFSARMQCGYLGTAQPSPTPLVKARTVFISDLHLGMPGTATRELIHFLASIQCDNLVMIGDVIDGWALGRKWRWKDRQETALDAILMHAANPKCAVTYIPGNHDEFWRSHMPDEPLGNVTFCQNLLYPLADGRKFWITHGDEHDSVTNHASWLSQFGSMLYEGGIQASKGFKRAQQYVGLRGFSATRQLKNLVKYVVQPPKAFEAQLSHDAYTHQAHGVLCGHIHRPELKMTDQGVVYGNTGDFVETASAMIEDYDGQLTLLWWSHKRGIVKRIIEAEMKTAIKQTH